MNSLRHIEFSSNKRRSGRNVSLRAATTRTGNRGYRHKPPGAGRARSGFVALLHSDEDGDRGARRRFGGSRAATSGRVVSDTDSLFRVWATDVTDSQVSMAAWFRAPLALTESAQKAVNESRSSQRHGDAGVHTEGNAHHHVSATAHGVRGSRRHDAPADGGVRHGSRRPPWTAPGKPGSTAEDACRVLDRSLGGQELTWCDQRSQRSVSEDAHGACGWLLQPDWSDDSRRRPMAAASTTRSRSPIPTPLTAPAEMKRYWVCGDGTTPGAPRLWRARRTRKLTEHARTTSCSGR